MLPDESSAGLAMAAGLAAAMAGAEGPRYVEAPDGTRILFFERSNISHDEGRDVARIVFSGCFSINGDMLLDRRGEPVEGGFEAMFDGPGDPVSAWAWLAEAVDDGVREKFEAVFGSTFSEDGLRMDIGPRRSCCSLTRTAGAPSMTRTTPSCFSTSRGATSNTTEGPTDRPSAPPSFAAASGAAYSFSKYTLRPA